MYIYLFVFSISIVFMRAAAKSDSSRNRIFFLGLSVLPLIILAALRGDNVGEDVSAYQRDLFFKALRFNSLTKYIKWSYEEPGYSFVTFLASRLGHFAFVHALNMLIILIPIYYVIWSVRNEYNPELVLATFLFLYYVQGYNVARQQMAISMLTLGTYFFSRKKHYLSILCVIVAVSFHYSALVGLSVYGIYWMAYSKFKHIYQVAFSFLTIAFAFSFEAIGKAVGKIMVETLHISKISYRSSRAWSSSTSDINETYLFFGFLGIVILVLVRYTKYKLQETSNIFLLYMMFIVFISVFITSKMGVVARIFCYFEIWIIFAIPQYIKLISNDWKSQTIARILFYSLMVVFWIQGVVIRGWNGVIPYYTFWQN